MREYKKYRNIFLFHLLIILVSCSDEPVGYIGLKDVDKPSVEIYFPANGEILSDSSEFIYVGVKAFDFFGLHSVNLYLNGSKYNPNDVDSIYTFRIPASKFKEDSNFVYATVVDFSGNKSLTNEILLKLKKTIIVQNSIDGLSLFDKSLPYIIDLNNVFKDTYKKDSNLNYEILSYSNKKILQSEIEDNFLTISPNKYRQGISHFEIKAVTDYRFNIHKFNVKIELTEPVRKVFIPDSIFRMALIEKYGFTDFEEDSIAQEEAENLNELDLHEYTSINNLSGLYCFISLEVLKIEAFLIDLDVSNNTNLRELQILHTFLTDLNLYNLQNLEIFRISHNFGNKPLSILFSNNINLKEISLDMSTIDKIDITSCTNINELYIGCCNISSLNLEYNTNISSLHLTGTNLSELDISQNSNLKYIDLRGNALLTVTYVWMLPLPEDVILYKDDHNILKLKN